MEMKREGILPTGAIAYNIYYPLQKQRLLTNTIPAKKGQKRGAKGRLLGANTGMVRGNPGRAESFKELIKKKCKSRPKQLKQLEILSLAIFC